MPRHRLEPVSCQAIADSDRGPPEPLEKAVRRDHRVIVVLGPLVDDSGQQTLGLVIPHLLGQGSGLSDRSIGFLPECQPLFGRTGLRGILNSLKVDCFDSPKQLLAFHVQIAYLGKLLRPPGLPRGGMDLVEFGSQLCQVGGSRRSLVCGDGDRRNTTNPEKRDQSKERSRTTL